MVLSQEVSEGEYGYRYEEELVASTLPPSKESQVLGHSQAGLHFFTIFLPCNLCHNYGKSGKLLLSSEVFIVCYDYYGNNCWVDFHSLMFCHTEEIKSSYKYDLIGFCNDILRNKD